MRWKIPDSKPDEIVHVNEPEIEGDTPHPDVSDPTASTNSSIRKRHVRY